MNEHQLTLKNPNVWFEKRRDFFVRQLVEDFFTVKLAFVNAYLVYLECRNPDAADCSDLLDVQAVEKRRQLWDHLVRLVGVEIEKGPLWDLKDLCHMVWPGNDHERDISGSLFDWLIGSIFHETMKLKENIYLLDRYGPAACRIKAGPLKSEHLRESGFHVQPADRLDNIVDVKGLIRRAAADAVRQMEQVAFLFNHASYMLRLKMPELVTNALVVRLIVEQEDMVGKIWGEDIADLFVDMFGGNAAEGFCTAGRSYMNSQWFSQALAQYRRALDMDSNCDEAITETVRLKKLIRDEVQPVAA